MKTLTILAVISLVAVSCSTGSEPVVLTYACDLHDDVVVVQIDRQTAKDMRDGRILATPEMRIAAYLALGGKPVQRVVPRTDEERRRDHESQTNDPHTGAHVQRLHERAVKP